MQQKILDCSFRQKPSSQKERRIFQSFLDLQQNDKLYQKCYLNTKIFQSLFFSRLYIFYNKS